ncbi:MAG TPA: hypothetical protein V6C97_12475 [Oculatellaceae cyanobacterium]
MTEAPEDLNQKEPAQAEARKVTKADRIIFAGLLIFSACCFMAVVIAELTAKHQ